MRAAVMDSAGRLAVRDVSLLPVSPHDVIVETTAAVVCVTDAIARRRDYPVHLAPQIRGHGGVGVVREVGEAVTLVRPGDRVIAAVRLQCGECYFCQRGQAEWCDRADGPPPREVVVGADVYRDRTDYPPPPVGTTAEGEALSAHARVGSYAELMRVPDIVLTRVVADVPDDQLAMLTCGVGTGMGAVFNQCTLEAGDSVVVVGCGVVGLSMVATARLLGAGLTIAVDPDPSRRRLAEAMGADVSLAPSADTAEQIYALTKARGADIGFEASGDPHGVEFAFHSTRRGAEVVLTGFGRPDASVSFGMNELAIRGRRVAGTQYGALQVRRDLPRYAALLEAGRVDITPLITHHVALDDLSSAIDAVESHAALGAIVDRF